MQLRRLPLRLPVALLGLSLGLAATPAAAQSVSIHGKGLTLREVTDRLSSQSGYPFYVNGDEKLGDQKHDVDWKALSLSRALTECGNLYRCDFYSIDTRGINVIPRQAEAAVRETTLGPYRLRVSPIVPTSEDPGVMHLTMILSAKDDEEVESLASLEGDIKVKDNFGRDLLPPTERFVLGLPQIRVRLTEYWLRLALTPADSRSVRVRSVTGTLLRYRSVKLLRFEFPLNDPAKPAQGHVQVQNGVEFRIDRAAQAGRLMNVTTSYQWSKSKTVVGRGLSRSPEPYLVDDLGKVYRDTDPRRSTIGDGNGNLITEQVLGFGPVAGKPVKLVYEVFLKEDPAPAYPFRLENIPLPTAMRAVKKPPFYEKEGATMVLKALGQEGNPLEGEMALALSRKQGAGWSGWHWFDRVTEPDGSLKVANLRPGVYRLRLQFRPDPSASPARLAEGPPAEMTLTVGKEVILPPLRFEGVKQGL